MSDVLPVVILLAFFAGAVGLVNLIDRMVLGPVKSRPAEADPAEDDPQEGESPEPGSPFHDWGWPR